MPVSRRHLFAASAAGAGIAVVGVPETASARGHDHHGEGRSSDAIGPLRDDPQGRLALPAGFSYHVISQVGTTKLTTGEPSPDRPDGTGAFRAGHHTRLVQNHEINPAYGSTYNVPTTEGTVYDAAIGAAGGCTVIELDGAGRRLREWVGLSGTLNNCAGGVTPWNSWLSCEEVTTRKGEAVGTATAGEDHGWVFEVQPDEPSTQHPTPIRAWGRFPHEAAVIGHDRRHVYLTEDASGGLFYRWSSPHARPLRRGDLHRLADNAGVLQAMRVSFPRGGGFCEDLSLLTSADIGRELDVEWVSVPDRFATTVDTRKQTYARPVTTAKKLEGAWGDEHGVWFAASFAFSADGDVPEAGVQHDGMIWFYDYRTGKLTLKAYFPYVTKLHDGTWSLAYEKSLANDVFDGPDNVHVSPWGGLVIAEDGVGVNGLIGFTEESGAFRLARNDVDLDGENSEMTGPTFSPDGRLLFANEQEPGYTYAISGPFRRYLTSNG